MPLSSPHKPRISAGNKTYEVDKVHVQLLCLAKLYPSNDSIRYDSGPQPAPMISSPFPPALKQKWMKLVRVSPLSYHYKGAVVLDTTWPQFFSSSPSNYICQEN